jgi:hypothetical protein
VCLRRLTDAISTLDSRSFVEGVKDFSYSKNGVNHWYIVIHIMHNVSEIKDTNLWSCSMNTSRSIYVNTGSWTLRL